MCFVQLFFLDLVPKCFKDALKQVQVWHTNAGQNNVPGGARKKLEYLSLKVRVFTLLEK